MNGMINCWTKGFYRTGCIEGSGYDTVAVGVVLIVIIGVLLIDYKRILPSKNKMVWRKLYILAVAFTRVSKRGVALGTKKSVYMNKKVGVDLISFDYNNSFKMILLLSWGEIIWMVK